MKTALKLGICLLFVSLFNLGVVKADTLPFELKEPPSGTKLIFDTIKKTENIKKFSVFLLRLFFILSLNVLFY